MLAFNQKQLWSTVLLLGLASLAAPMPAQGSVIEHGYDDTDVRWHQHDHCTQPDKCTPPRNHHYGEHKNPSSPASYDWCVPATNLTKAEQKRTVPAQTKGFAFAAIAFHGLLSIFAIGFVFSANVYDDTANKLPKASRNTQLRCRQTRLQRQAKPQLRRLHQVTITCLNDMSQYRGYFVPGGVDPWGLQNHHWFPQEFENEIFHSCGDALNIHRYTEWIPQPWHNWLHNHWKGTGGFNEAFDDILDHCNGDCCCILRNTVGLMHNARAALYRAMGKTRISPVKTRPYPGKFNESPLPWTQDELIDVDGLLWDSICRNNKPKCKPDVYSAPKTSLPWYVPGDPGWDIYQDAVVCVVIAGAVVCTAGGILPAAGGAGAAGGGAAGSGPVIAGTIGGGSGTCTTVSTAAGVSIVCGGVTLPEEKQPINY